MGFYRLCAVFMALLVQGCSTCAGDQNEPAPLASATIESFVSGDKVVAEYARAAFFEGKVTVAAGATLTILDESSGQARQVDSANVYRLENGQHTKITWKAGEFGICQSAPMQWTACRVSSAHDQAISVVDEKLEEHSLAPNEILVPTPVTVLNLEHAFKRVDKAKRFTEELKNVGPLFRPLDWKPRVGESILLRTGSSHISATVNERRTGLLLVQLAGTGEKPRAVALEDAWPEPPVDAAIVVGGYACVRPVAGEYVWRIVRIETKEQDKIRVSLPTGDERVVEERDLLPFLPKRPSESTTNKP